jgi:hypothetical protein
MAVSMVPSLLSLCRLSQAFVSQPRRCPDHLQNGNSYLSNVVGSVTNEAPSGPLSSVANALQSMYSSRGQLSEALDLTCVCPLWAVSLRPSAHPQHDLLGTTLKNPQIIYLGGLVHLFMKHKVWR